MQDSDWNDLKYLLALHRFGSFAEAGRRTGASETTVARRIRALEETLGAKLAVKDRRGTYTATDIGLKVIDYAEAMERASDGISDLVGGFSASLAGTVRISAVPFVVNRILVPALATLSARHPDLVVELAPEARNIDLTKREADLAVRLARPASGGFSTIAKRIGSLAFDLYGAACSEHDGAHSLKWITYTDDHVSLPQARWLENAVARSGEPSAAFRVADLETALEATARGLGKTLLPVCAAASDRRLQKLAIGPAAKPPPVRDVWVLSHRDQSGRSSIAAVKSWLAKVPWK